MFVDDEIWTKSLIEGLLKWTDSFKVCIYRFVLCTEKYHCVGAIS